jgi:hypothetical protein
MNNRQVSMRSVCPVRVLVYGMEMENGQQKQSREENCENPYTPGW